MCCENVNLSVLSPAVVSKQCGSRALEMWLVELWNYVFKFYLIVINLNLNNHMWLVAAIWSSTILEFYGIEVEILIFT